MTDKAKAEYFTRLFHLFRLYQRRNRVVSRARESKLSLPEAHALVEIDRLPGIGAGDLMRLLGLSKSAKARLLTRLADQAMIKQTPHPDHAAHFALYLTRSGRHELSKYDRAGEQNIKVFTAGFSAGDIELLVTFFRSLADFYAAPQAPRRLDEHPLRPEMRRVTRALDLWGESVMGSGISAVQWHLLSELAKSTHARFTIEFVTLLNTPLTTLGENARNLAQKKLIERSTSEHDKRHVALSILPAGRKLLQNMEEQYVQTLLKAFEPASLAEIQRITELFAKMAGGMEPDEKGLTTKSAQNGDDLQELRLFYVREVAAEEEPRRIPERIYAEKNPSFGLYIAGVPRAAVEFECGADLAVAKNFVCQLSKIPEGGLATFISECLRYLGSNRSNTLRVEISEDEPLRQAFAAALKAVV